MTWRILTGDCIEQMRTLDDSSIDAVVCDPPYGIGFMGKEWDGKAIAEAAARDRATRKSLGPESASRPGRAQPRSSSAFGNEAIIAGPVRGGVDFQAWCESWATEAWRVLKPGGHLLAFGGPRTFHRLVAGIEDAGFEIRDSIMWLYGSGFPKSLNVAKAIDSGGGRPEDRRREAMGDDYEPSGRGRVNYDHGGGSAMNGAPAAPPRSEQAQQWDGWGTTLKPAHEPIVVARKPLVGTVAANVLEHGTGAINVDACRIEHDGSGVWGDHGQNPENHQVNPGGDGTTLGTSWFRPGSSRHDDGRWPANVVLDEDWEPILCLRNTLDSDAWEILSEWCDARSSDVPRVRGRDRRAAEPGESPEILLAAVPASVDVEESSRRRSPDDGPEAPAGVDREDEGEPQIGDRSRESELEGVVPESGLPVHQPAGRPGGAGAPVGDGTRVGATADGRGDRSPHQRSENGQPTGEPGGSPAGRPHSPSRRHLSGAARAARAGREVLLRDVPAPWLKHFEFTGDVAAVGAAAMLDEQTGELKSGFMAAGTARDGLGYHGALGNTVSNDTHGDSGGASRFFYCAKTSRAERNAGLEGFAKRQPRTAMEGGERVAEGRTAAPGHPEPAANHHPTVKPINLMRWLVRLVTPPGGTVLDPFTGSGSTGCAAVLEGFDFIGCEREEEYVAIAEARIAFWAKHVGRGVEDVLGLVAASSRHRERHEHHGTLFDQLQEEAA